MDLFWLVIQSYVSAPLLLKNLIFILYSQVKHYLVASFRPDIEMLELTFLEMKKLGWTMGVLQFPPALHLDVTGLTTKTGVIDEFIKVCFVT